MMWISRNAYIKREINVFSSVTLTNEYVHTLRVTLMSATALTKKIKRNLQGLQM
jgi:hypothetical protein